MGNGRGKESWMEVVGECGGMALVSGRVEIRRKKLLWRMLEERGRTELRVRVLENV